tara:strand:- start:59 stop:862 length:804 start_codon:yes stop_codon:yes gene_type:complete
MQSILDKAISAAEPMPLFGIAHLLPILSLGLFIAFLCYSRNSHSGTNCNPRIELWLAWVLFFSFPTYVLLQVLEGSLTWDTALPLYPCPLMSLMAPILVRSQNQSLFNLFFYWVFAGTLQAVITPEVKSSFPHFEYFYFWSCHGGLLALLSYTLIVQGKRPTQGGILSAFGWLNILIGIAFVANQLTGANFFYLRAKPTVPTLLDYLGPWPWYVLGAQVTALAQFALSYAVLRLLISKFKQRKSLAKSIGHKSPLENQLHCNGAKGL